MQLRARINGELQALGWEPVTDPVARYADLAGETLAFKDLARERINELQSWEHASEFDAQDIHAAVKVYQWALEQSERILGRMSSVGLTTEILREALHLEAERPTREQMATLTAVLDKVLADPRVSLDPAVARQVVVDAMVAARHRRSCAIREVDSDRWPQGRQPNPANSGDHEVSLLGPSWLATPDPGDDRLRARTGLSTHLPSRLGGFRRESRPFQS
jgi:hypothetical protein